jgi:hypothetical protein
MEQLFQQLFKFTDYVLAHAGQILVSFIVLFVLIALAKALLESIVGGTAEIFGLSRKSKGHDREREHDPAGVAGIAAEISKVVKEEVEKEISPEIERKRRKKGQAEEAPKAAPQPQPIMVAHPLDIKDEASRRLYEEEVEKEKEQMRLRLKSE